MFGLTLEGKSNKKKVQNSAMKMALEKVNEPMFPQLEIEKIERETKIVELREEQEKIRLEKE